MKLTKERMQLLDDAGKAARKAHAPYSGFRVGAALLAAGGGVYSGCNVESSSYSLSICAERVALYKAVNEGERNFTEMVITTLAEEKDAAPCGACRQVLHEFAPGLLVTFRLGGQYITREIKELLPDAFGGKGERGG